MSDGEWGAGVKIWLDDERPAPDDTWVHATSALDCIDLLEGYNVDELSLDHDLGDGEMTGYHVSQWLETHPEHLPKVVTIHSANPVGARRMAAALSSARKRETEL